jgi:hypothetical protein
MLEFQAYVVDILVHMEAIKEARRGKGLVDGVALRSKANQPLKACRLPPFPLRDGSSFAICSPPAALQLFQLKPVSMQADTATQESLTGCKKTSPA